MDREDYYALIEKKIDDTLTAEEQIVFDHQMQTDLEFAQAYQQQSSVVYHFRQRQRRQLHQTLEAGYQASKKKQAKQRSFYHYIAIAATITLLLTVTVAFFYFRTPSPEALYTAYYQPYQAKYTTRGGSLEQENRARDLYSEGQLAAAIPLLKTLSDQEEGPQVDRWRLLLGNAYLQSDSVAQALQSFEQVTHSSDAIYRQYGVWYLALSYLKQKDLTAAKELLQPITQQPGLFQHDAQQLLDELP